MDGAGEGQYLAIELPGQTRITKTTFKAFLKQKTMWPNRSGNTIPTSTRNHAMVAVWVGSDDDSNACGCQVGLGGDGEEELTRELAPAPRIQC